MQCPCGCGLEIDDQLAADNTITGLMDRLDEKVAAFERHFTPDGEQVIVPILRGDS